MQCKCMTCGNHFTLSDDEADRFREFFEDQGTEPPPEAFGICGRCWKDDGQGVREIRPARAAPDEYEQGGNGRGGGGA
jgi:hypothetical protein